MKKQRLSSCLVGLLFVAPSLATAQGLSVSGSVQDANGHFVSQLDNPVISGSVTLNSPDWAKSTEHNPNTNTFAWEYDNFELDMATMCSASDPNCVNVSGPAGLTWYHPAPTTVGEWYAVTGTGCVAGICATANLPDSMPFESHGAEIGHSPADIHITKYNSTPAVVQDMMATVSLDPQTYLVPMNSAYVTMTRDKPIIRNGLADDAICVGDSEIPSMLATWSNNLTRRESTRTV